MQRDDASTDKSSKSLFEPEVDLTEELTFDLTNLSDEMRARMA